MTKVTISSLFVMTLLASPSFALFFASEPRGIEHMNARDFDVMFRREVQAHKDLWVEVDEKLKVIDLPWLPFLSRTFITRYRDFIIKHNKHHTTPITTATAKAGPVSPSPSAPTGPTHPPAGGNSGSAAAAPPVTVPEPSLPPVVSSPPEMPSAPAIPDNNAAQSTVAARDYIQSLIARTYATFSGSELDTRGFSDSDEDFFAREPQLQYTDELYERGYDDDLFERGVEDDILEGREYEIEDNYVRGYGADDVEDNFAREASSTFEVFGREYAFDDLD